MDLHCQMIMDEYYENKPVYEKMRDVVIDKVKSLIEDSGMIVAICEARVKEENSLIGKLELKGAKYKRLSDITDILGVRIVTFYTDHVDKISSLVESAFNVDWNESVDKRKNLANDQFGYMSLHYICRIPESLYCDPDHPEINELRFEVQMRTTLQHEWATAFHDTGYKSDIEIPKVYIRALNRLAGLLEIADDEFSRIMNELSDYRRKVSALISEGQLENLSLDGDTFGKYLETDPFELLNDRIAKVNRAEIAQVNMMPYLEVLIKLGFETLSDVEEMKKKYSDEAYAFAISRIGSTDLDIVASNVGIKNLCIIYALKEKGEGGLFMIADNIFGEGARGQRGAQRTINQAKELGII